MSDIELPDLQQAELDEASLADLFRDVELAAELIAVTRKDGPEARACETSLTLAEAHDLLRTGRTRSIQIRYRYQGAQWWDTLLRTPTGVRLVRVRHDFR